MPAPLRTGLAGFRLLVPSDLITSYGKRRAKLSGSTRNVRAGTPVIAGASNTLDRINITGGTNEVQRLTPAQGAADTGGTFKINLLLPSGTVQTASIAFSASLATIQAAIEAVLPNSNRENPTDAPKIRGTNSVVASGGPLFTAAGGLGSAVDLTFTGKFSAQNITATTITSSLTGTTPSITPSTVTAGVYGYASSTTFIGFANEFEQGPLAAPVSGGSAAYGREFAQAPLNLDGPFASSAFEILYWPAGPHPFEFEAAIEPWLPVTAGMVGTSYDLGYNVTYDQFYVSTATTTAAIVKVTAIPDGQLGVYGGLVRATILPAAVAY